MKSIFLFIFLIHLFSKEINNILNIYALKYNIYFITKLNNLFIKYINLNLSTYFYLIIFIKNTFGFKCKSNKIIFFTPIWQRERFLSRHI